MNSNTYTIYDSEGDYPDWVEIYNPGTEEIDLSGMYLTDDLTDVEKWQIPADVKIAGGRISFNLPFGQGQKNRYRAARLLRTFQDRRNPYAFG